MKRRWRLWRRVIVILLILGISFTLAVPRIARAIIRSRLQAMIAEQSDAKLEIGDLIYNAPYGVTVLNASVIAPGPDGAPLELLHIGKVELQLDKLPFGSGPLIIKSLAITDPTVHLIRTARGMAGSKGGAPIGPSSASSGPPLKLSDILRLTHFALNNGSIVYEDRTLAGAVPLAWWNLNVDLNTVQQSAGAYTYHLIVKNEPLATLESNGTADLDALLLNVEKCALIVNVDPHAQESALPAEHQRLLRAWRVGGSLAIDLSGTIPFRDLPASSYRAALELKDATATIPKLNVGLEKVAFKIDVDSTNSRRPAINVHSLTASAASARIDLHDVVASADLNAGKWTLTGLKGHLDRAGQGSDSKLQNQIDNLKLTGAMDFAANGSGPLHSTDLNKFAGRIELTPTDLSFQPPGFDNSVSGLVPAVIQLADGKASVNTLRATVGDHLLFVKHASAGYDQAARALHLTDLSGCLTFGPSEKYPKPLADLLASCRPVGPYFFDGTVDLSPAKPIDYNLEIHTKRGQLTVSDSQIPITGIDTSVKATRAGAEIVRFEGSTLQGSISATGTAKLADRSSYKVNVNCKNIDLRELGERLATPGQKPPQMSGHAVISAELEAPFPRGDDHAYQGLVGKGSFQIIGGDFARVPALSTVTDVLHLKDAATVGDAEGEFHIAANKVHFDHALATSPAAGIEGSGDVGFDGALDMRFIAKFLGKWGDRFGAIDDGGGIAKVLNTVQKGVDVASRKAAYEITVRGTISDPKPGGTALPFLQRQFERMKDYKPGQ